MIEKQKVHLKDTGEPLRILLPIRLHQILATNPSREFVAFSVFDGSPHIPESLAMPFIVPPIKSEVFPFHGAQYANGVQIRVTKGELDILLVFDPDMSDFTELHPPPADADQLDVRYVRLSARRWPSPAEIEKLVSHLESAERPVLIHCQGGTDRSGLAAAIAFDTLGNYNLVFVSCAGLLLASALMTSFARPPKRMELKGAPMASMRV